MSDYRLADGGSVIRTLDNAGIPSDPANRDYAAYLVWVAAGGIPDPAIPVAAADPLDWWDVISLKVDFNHENRIRALEGKAAVTITQFKAAVKALL